MILNHLHLYILILKRNSSVFSLLGRFMVALLFIQSAISKLMQPTGTAQFMASVGLPEWPVLAVVTGIFELVAALALLIGWRARSASLYLAAFTLLANLLFHAFWSLPTDQHFVAQLLFMKNIAVIGGLLFVSAFGCSQSDRRLAHPLVCE